MNLTDEQKEELKCKIEVEKTLRRSRVLAQLPDDSVPEYLPKNKWLISLYRVVELITI